MTASSDGADRRVEIGTWKRFGEAVGLGRAGAIGGTLRIAVAAGCLSACSEQPLPPKQATRVRVEVAAIADYLPEVALTGVVAARVTSELSFRISGQVSERTVEVGEHVTADQVLARLEPAEQQASLDAAEADVSSAEAKLRQAASTFERQKTLMAQGYTTRREYDQAEQDLRTSQGALDGAKAQRGTARDQLDQTVMKAGAAGFVTARSVEAGQVVQAAQTVYTVAEDGPRDAVFDVYEAIFVREPVDRAISLTLVSDPKVRALAHPREIAPVVDQSSGTVRVKFDIVDPPASMTLGAAVVGVGRFKSDPRIVLPWSVLSSRDGKAAVWTVDPTSKAVSLRPITIEAYEAERIVVRDGIEAGQIVVSRGQQLLRPGQVVEPVEDGAS